MDNFDTLGLPEALTHTLQHMQFVKPTPVQAEVLPWALQGKDILGSAQTGTGKTGAFGIPLVARLLASSRGSALVMAPTRELATQVMEQLQAMLGKRSKIKTALLIGGESITKQLQQLKNRPRVLVGTPGRINDHLERGSLMLHDASFLVLDETDRMLDMGFTDQIEKILKYLPQQRQTLLFSATLPKNIVKIAQTYLTDPIRVSVGTNSSPAQNIKHEVIRITHGEKFRRLCDELEERNGSVIIFVKTKHGTERLADKLRGAGHEAAAIHGDLRQSKRDRVIAQFRDMKHRILVATDVAARGLDIPHIEHVINHDLPQCAEDYIHRIGRTARAGAEGEAICFVTPEDRGHWAAIQRLMDPDAAEEEGEYTPKPRRSRSRNGRGSDQKRGPRRSDGERKPREEKRKPRAQAAEGESKPRREKKGEWEGKSKDAKPSGDRKPRRDGKPSGERKRSEGDRKPRRDGKPSGERKRSEGERKPRRDGKPSGERKRSEGDRKPRRDGAKPSNRSRRPQGGRDGNRPPRRK